MLNYDGTIIMVTPSILYSDEVAIAGVDAGEQGHIFVKCDGRDSDEFGGDRQVYLTIIYDSNGEQIYKNDDLRSDVGVYGAALEGLHAFISLLLACAESPSEESENYYLFDSNTREWAEMVSDELSSISLEIDEELGCNCDEGGSAGCPVHDSVDGIDRQAEENYRRHSSSITGINEGL